MTDTAFPITIFHNPACGTSRNTVAMVQAAGYAPQVVEYLKAGWTREQLRDLAARSGGSLRARNLMLIVTAPEHAAASKATRLAAVNPSAHAEQEYQKAPAPLARQERRGVLNV